MKESITLMDVFGIDEIANSERPLPRERFTKIGVGFVNRDESINVVLDFFPKTGRLQIRKREAKFDQEGKVIQKQECSTHGGELAEAVKTFLATPFPLRDSIVLQEALAKFEGRSL